MAGAGRGDLTDNVTLTVLVRTAGDRMHGVATGPKAEAIMVLGGQNQLPEATRFRRSDDLLGTEVGRVEDRRIFITGSPFAVGESVDREVQESVSFEIMPRPLARGRQRPVGFGPQGRVLARAREQRL